jgi:hypothetical protein
MHNAWLALRYFLHKRGEFTIDEGMPGSILVSWAFPRVAYK